MVLVPMNRLQKIREKLFQVPPEEYGEKYSDHLLAQYKTYLEMADRISARRQTAHSFFVTLNTAIIALVGYMNLGGENNVALCGLIPIAGMILCFMWYRLIRSYKDLNRAKFKVVHAIESKLPIAPFDGEWEAVERGKNPRLYLPFTRIEICIPWIFFVVHFFVLLRCMPLVSAFESLYKR